MMRIVYPGSVAVTEEFLNQAEKCLMDIEQFETEEEIKMELINLLYSHIQLQRQGLLLVGILCQPFSHLF